MLFSILLNYSALLPEMLNLISYLRTEKMLDIITPSAKKQDYKADYLVMSDVLSNGRPHL